MDFRIIHHPCIPGIKPTWSGWMIVLMCSWIRLVRILLSIFASVFIREIGLLNFYLLYLGRCVCVPWGTYRGQRRALWSVFLSSTLVQIPAIKLTKAVRSAQHLYTPSPLQAHTWLFRPSSSLMSLQQTLCPYSDLLVLGIPSSQGTDLDDGVGKAVKKKVKT